MRALRIAFFDCLESRLEAMSLSTANPNADDDAIVAATRRWVDRAVVGLNLCPFAKAVVVKEQVRYVVSPARTPEALLEQLMDEMQALADADPDKIDTTLLRTWVVPAGVGTSPVAFS